jgi:hypothetical protein
MLCFARSKGSDVTADDRRWDVGDGVICGGIVGILFVRRVL